MVLLNTCHVNIFVCCLMCMYVHCIYCSTMTIVCSSVDNSNSAGKRLHHNTSGFFDTNEYQRSYRCNSLPQYTFTDNQLINTTIDIPYFQVQAFEFRANDTFGNGELLTFATNCRWRVTAITFVCPPVCSQA